MKNTKTFKYLLTAALTIAALATGQATAWAQAPWSGSGTEDDPYVISTTSDLDNLAADVNNSTYLSYNAYFVLANDIAYTHSEDWDDATSTENNYTPIGGCFNYSTRSFSGTFDGRGHTISGIRIYRNGTGNVDAYLGLFGSVTGTVQNVTVSDMRITGYTKVGGIAGENCNGGKIVNCHATATVALHALQNDAYYFGGIVGNHYHGFISGCSSAVTITVTGTPKQCTSFGGIVGECDGDMRNCLAVGVRLPAIHYHDAYNDNDVSGAIAGYMALYHVITDNYYSGCYLDGVLTESGIGVGDDNTHTRHDLTSFEYNDYDYNNITCTNCAEPAATLRTLSVGASIFAAGSVCPKTDGNAYSVIPGTEVTLGYNGAVDTYQVTTYSLGGTPLRGNTFTMPDADASATVSVVTIWNTDHSADGSAEKPFIISTALELDELARRVNNGTGDPDARTGYSGKYFELGGNITYSTEGIGETESNYTPIGNSDNEFYGNFDGKNKTVSGIRIYRGGDNWDVDWYLGLFGYLDGGTVQNVTVSDMHITGYKYVGGIMGENYRGTVQNCHATSTVILRAVQDYADPFGGIAGYNNRGTIDGCTSAATIGKVGSINDFGYCGGIVGSNNGVSSQKGVIQNCLALGANVTADNNAGAIVGYNSYTTDTSLSQNYYNGCTVNGETTGIGTNGSDITDNDGAVPGYLITLGTGVTSDALTIGTYTVATNGATVTLGHGDREGYSFINGSYSVKDTSNGDVDVSEDAGVYSFTMPAKDVTVTATWTTNASLDITSISATLLGGATYVTTFYHGTLDYELPSGAKAYTASLDGSNVVFHLVGDDGSVIPHGTAVIVVAGAADITLTMLPSTTVEPHTGNILQGSDAAVTVTAGKVDGKTPYVLNISGEVLGFYKFAGSAIPAGKAYYLKNE